MIVGVDIFHITIIPESIGIIIGEYMSFYDSERIERKNQKFVKSKAYEAVRDFESKGLNIREIIGCLEVLLVNKENTETQIDVLNFALKTLKFQGEIENETINNSDDDDLSGVQ